MACHAGLPGAGAGGLVAADAQCDGPAARLGRHRCQFATGQLQIEEPRDVRLGKAQILGGQHGGVLAEHGLCQVEPGRQLAAGDGDVQARRRIAEQVVQEPDGARVRRALGLVERQDAGASPRLECAQQEGGAGIRLAESGLAAAQRCEQVDSGFLEGERKVGVEGARVVVAGQGDPGDRHAAGDGAPAGIREQHGLAEAARRHQDGDALVCGRAPAGQFGPVAVAGGRPGDGDAMPRQPVRPGLRGRRRRCGGLGRRRWLP